LTDLVNRKQDSGRYAGAADPELQTGGISIDQDAYTTGLDRIYDVKGMDRVYVEIKNTGGTNSLTYTIQKSRKEFTLLTELVDADFDQTVLDDTDVAFGVTDPHNITDVASEITAIRIRIKRTTAGQSTTMAGIFSATSRS